MLAKNADIHIWIQVALNIGLTVNLNPWYDPKVGIQLYCILSFS